MTSSLAWPKIESKNGGPYLQTQQTFLKTQYIPGTQQTFFQTQHGINQTQQRFNLWKHNTIISKHNTTFAKHTQNSPYYVMQDLLQNKA